MPWLFPRARIAALALAGAVAALPLLAGPAEARPAPPLGAQVAPVAAPAQADNWLAWDDFEDAEIGILPGGTDAGRNFAVGYEAGEYVIYQANPDWELFPQVKIPGEYDNTTLAVSARLVGDPVDRFLAFGCRSDDEAQSEYRLLLTPFDQQFAVVSIVNGEVTELIPYQPTPALGSGNRSNRIAFSCNRSQLSVTINDITISSIEDPSLQAGRLWIGVGVMPGAVGTAEARFDDLIVTAE